MSRSRRLIAFRWYGGKFIHLDWILPLLPEAHHYCEPFGGAASVLLNRPPSPIETYNDIDGDVVNFFRVLRDKPDELIERLMLTPYSREEFRRAIEAKGRTDIDDVERARLFFVRVGQVRLGIGQRATPGTWAWVRRHSCRGMAGSVSRWWGYIERLYFVAERLRRVQIENRPALEVIRLYDSEDTLFYCDPPYPHESRRDVRVYAFEMSDKDHEELAEVLHSVKGKVALSSYRCELMDRLYSDWVCVESPLKFCRSARDYRREAVWMNYDPREFSSLLPR